MQWHVCTYISSILSSQSHSFKGFLALFFAVFWLLFRFFCWKVYYFQFSFLAKVCSLRVLSSSWCNSRVKTYVWRWRWCHKMTDDCYLCHSRTRAAARDDQEASNQSQHTTGTRACARHEESVAVVSVLRLVQLTPVFRCRRLRSCTRNTYTGIIHTFQDN